MDPIHNKEISVGDLVKEHTKHKNDKKGDKNKNGSITQQNNKRG